MNTFQGFKIIRDEPNEFFAAVHLIGRDAKDEWRQLSIHVPNGRSEREYLSAPEVVDFCKTVRPVDQHKIIG